MNYATIKKFDIANGPGVRVSLFVSGCRHHCKNCFNKEAWDFNYGAPLTDEVINEILEACKPSHITGLSLLGGEPFEKENRAGLITLVRKFRELYPEKNVWCYTGFVLDEELLKAGGIYKTITTAFVHIKSHADPIKIDFIFFCRIGTTANHIAEVIQ